MKKLLSIIIAILMIVTTIPIAFAADVVASGNCGDNGGNVKWTLDSDGTLTISGTGNMADYEGYPDVPWADYTSDVKKLIIEDGVTSISDHTAYGCFYATSISIGKDVKSIGPIKSTFYCRELETITVSEDNEYYKSVDNVLFSKDGKELLKVACKAFSGTYNVPDGVVKINEKAFDICKNIEKVVLSDSVEEIGDWAFYQCQSLKILDIGMAKISSVGDGVFEWIEHPVEVIVDKDNEYVSVVDGSLFSKIDGTLFYTYVTDNKCVVPYGVKIIPYGVIHVEDGSVVVPDTVETIELHGINVFDSVVHYLGTESQLQEIYEGDMSDFYFEWQNISMHYCVQQSNISASCTDDGVTEWYCSTCDETIKYVTGYAFGHDIVEVEAKAPTCTQVGNEAYEYCTTCDYTTYVELPADPDAHTPLEAVKENEVAPKCDVTGSYDLVVYCACGAELDRDTKTVDALRHSFTKYEVTEEAKCGVEGKEVAYCDHGCGATDEKAIAALEHKDDDGDYICDNGCGHEFEKPAPEEPTPDTPDEPEDETCADCGKVHINFFSEIICFFTRIIKFIKNLFA